MTICGLVSENHNGSRLLQLLLSLKGNMVNLSRSSSEGHSLL